MATFVQERHNDGAGSTPGIVVTISPTAGNLLAICVGLDRDSGATVSVTTNGSGGTAPSQLVRQAPVTGTSLGEEIWGTANCPSSVTSITVAISGGGTSNRAQVSVLEFSGTSLSFGTTATSGATSTTFSLAPASASIVAGGFSTIIGNANSASPTNGTYGVNNATPNNQGNVYHTSIYNLGGGTISCTFTSQRWDGAAVQIVEGGGGATTRGTPFGNGGTAFNGGRAMQGILRARELNLQRAA